MGNEMKLLTAEQDQTGYDIFETVARLHGIGAARLMLADLARKFDLPITNRDIQFWATTYRERNEG